MFTGLIESVGEIADITAIDGGFRLGIRSELSSELRDGESVAVNGVCLTVVGTRAGQWFTEIGPETVKVTSLGGLKRGAMVNLERAMRADGRFGGHLVLGHVDGTGAIQAVRPESDFSRVTISYPSALRPLLIHRGSVAVDGISLTVARLDAKTFDVQIVPFTSLHTNLRAAQVGDHVNLECDMVGKYVLHAVEQYAEQYVVSGFPPPRKASADRHSLGEGGGRTVDTTVEKL